MKKNNNNPIASDNKIDIPKRSSKYINAYPIVKEEISNEISINKNKKIKRSDLKFLKDKKKLLTITNKIISDLNNLQNESQPYLNILILSLYSSSKPVYDNEKVFKESLKTLNSIIELNDKELKIKNKNKKITVNNFKEIDTIELYRREIANNGFDHSLDIDLLFKKLVEELNKKEEKQSVTIETPILINKMNSLVEDLVEKTQIKSEIKTINLENNKEINERDRSPVMRKVSCNSTLQEKESKIKILNKKNINEVKFSKGSVGIGSGIRKSPSNSPIGSRTPTLIKSNTTNNILKPHIKAKILKIDLRKKEGSFDDTSNVNITNIKNQEKIKLTQSTTQSNNTTENISSSCVDFNQFNSSKLIYKKKINSGAGFTTTRNNLSNSKNTSINSDIIVDSPSQNTTIKSISSSVSGNVEERISNNLPITKYSKAQTSRGSYVKIMKIKKEKEDEKEKEKEKEKEEEKIVKNRLSKSPTKRNEQKENLNKSNDNIFQVKIDSEISTNKKEKLNLSFDNSTKNNSSSSKKEKFIFKIDLSKDEPLDNNFLVVLQEDTHKNEKKIINDKLNKFKNLKNYFQKDRDSDSDKNIVKNKNYYSYLETDSNFNLKSELDIINENETDECNDNSELDRFSFQRRQTPKFDRKISNQTSIDENRFSFNVFNRKEQTVSKDLFQNETDF